MMGFQLSTLLISNYMHAGKTWQKTAGIYMQNCSFLPRKVLSTLDHESANLDLILHRTQSKLSLHYYFSNAIHLAANVAAHSRQQQVVLSSLAPQMH